MKKILVTGATGFIGRHLVPLLEMQGFSPRVIVRDLDKLMWLFPNSRDVVCGDLQDKVATAQAMQGVDTVLHLAALATAYNSDSNQYMRDNSEAVQMLLDEAARAGVRRFVHVSTIAALPPQRKARQWGVPRRLTPYAKSKIKSEELVREYAAAGHDAVIVRPTRVYGPGPWNDANGTTRMIAMYLTGHFRFRMRDGGVQANYVYVKDVAQGVLSAAEHGQSGASYELGGQNASLVGFLAAIDEASGTHHRVMAVPPAACAVAAHLGAGWGKLGGSPSLTPEWLNNFLEHRPVDISRSRRDLNYDPLMLPAGLTETLNWLLKTEGGDPHAYQGTLLRREAWA